MERTPKRGRMEKRLEVDQSSPIFGNNDYEGTSISYDFLPESSKIKGRATPVSLRKRRSQFMKSPLYESLSSIKTVKQKDSNDIKRKCTALFNNMFNKGKEDSKENNEQIREANDTFINKKQQSQFGTNTNQSCSRINETLNDSSSDALYELSQQVEQDAERIQRKNFTPPKTNKVVINKENITLKSRSSRRSIARESHKDSSVKLLLEDGNDAGFIELDETTISQSFAVPNTLSQKCTAEEIEAKRIEALKKLREKKSRVAPRNFVPKFKCK